MYVTQIKTNLLTSAGVSILKDVIGLKWRRGVLSQFIISSS